MRKKERRDHPATLASALDYNALQQPISGTLGNGIAQSRTYDNRARLTSLTDGSVYNISTITYSENSDILTANDSVNGNWTYVYDDFNRLASSSKTGVTYTYVYDRFGNRWQQNNGWRSSLSFDANNHILPSNGMYYDAAGNLTNDSFHTYAYDAENRLISVDSGATTYAYDGADRRVRKATGASTFDYLYDQSGHVITEVDGTSTWTRGEVYAGSTHLATYASGASGTTYFEHTDWLGTSRARSGVSGSSAETCTSLPFGDGLSCAGTEPSPLHFTSQQRDTETQLDHFWYRQYSSAEGRFTAVDPALVRSIDRTMPQSLNGYAYVADNPNRFTDPTGAMMVLVGPPDPVGCCCPALTNTSFGGGGGAGGAKGSCQTFTNDTPKHPFGSLCAAYHHGNVQAKFIQEWSCKGDLPCCVEKMKDFRDSCEARGKDYFAVEDYPQGSPVMQCCYLP